MTRRVSVAYLPSAAANGAPIGAVITLDLEWRDCVEIVRERRVSSEIAHAMAVALMGPEHTDAIIGRPTK